MKRVMATLSMVLAPLAEPSPAAAYWTCTPGEWSCPTEITMLRGTNAITITGKTSPGSGCCAYAFRARAGQTLSWTLEGATSLTVMVTQPDGHVDGPELPQEILLPQHGIYVIRVRADLTDIEDKTEPFRLSISIR
jgi:hypothetical protein